MKSWRERLWVLLKVDFMASGLNIGVTGAIFGGRAGHGGRLP